MTPETISTPLAVGQPERTRRRCALPPAATNTAVSSPSRTMAAAGTTTARAWCSASMSTCTGAPTGSRERAGGREADRHRRRAGLDGAGADTTCSAGPSGPPRCRHRASDARRRADARRARRRPAAPPRPPRAGADRSRAAPDRWPTARRGRRGCASRARDDAVERRPHRPRGRPASARPRAPRRPARPPPRRRRRRGRLSSTSRRAATPRSNSSLARCWAARAWSSGGAGPAPTSASCFWTSAALPGISKRTSTSPGRTASPAARGISTMRAASGATTTRSAPGAGATTPVACTTPTMSPTAAGAVFTATTAALSTLLRPAGVRSAARARHGDDQRTARRNGARPSWQRRPDRPARDRSMRVLELRDGVERAQPHVARRLQRLQQRGDARSARARYDSSASCSTCCACGRISSR